MSNDHLTLIDRFLRYEEDTGRILWRKSHGSRTKAGDPAGAYRPHCPVRIGIGGQYFNGQDIAWYLAHGEWPDAPVIHLNGNRWDNRIENLSQAG